MTHKERFHGINHYAPSTLGDPAHVLEPIDYSVFQKDAAEKQRAKDVKWVHKNLLRQAYGNKWKKHLNINSQSIGNKITISF